MKTYTVEGVDRVSLLERAARKIEPKPEELDAVRKLPAHSRVARALKPAQYIDDMVEVMTAHKGQAPKPTNLGVKMLDGASMRFHTDGSLRHAGGRIKGKAARKAAKRARHAR